MTTPQTRVGYVSRAILGRVIARAMAEYPREACGVIFGRDGVPGFLQGFDNVHETPTVRFEVSEAEQLELWAHLDDMGLDPLVAYHSHTGTNAFPSGADIENHDPSMLMLIVSVRFGHAPVAMLWDVSSGVPVSVPVGIN